MIQYPLRVETRCGGYYFLSLSVDSYHCLVFFALSCASKNTFFSALMSEGRGKKDKIKQLTLSLGHLESLSEHQRCVSRLSTASCGPECCEMLRLVNDLDETISKSLPGNVLQIKDTITRRVRRNVRKRALVNNSDISLAGTSSRLHKSGGCSTLGGV